MEQEEQKQEVVNVFTINESWTKKPFTCPTDPALANQCDECQ